MSRDIVPGLHPVIEPHDYQEAGGNLAGECLVCGNVREAGIHSDFPADEREQLKANLRRIEELRGAADSIAEFVIGAVNVLDDEKEKLHVIDMVIMRLSRGVATALEASEPDSATSAIQRLAAQFGWSGFTILQGTLCGPTGDEMFCACGCGGDDTRCEYWLTMRNLGQEVADSHTCCKVGNGQTGGG